MGRVYDQKVGVTAGKAKEPHHTTESGKNRKNKEDVAYEKGWNDQTS